MSETETNYEPKRYVRLLRSGSPAESMQSVLWRDRWEYPKRAVSE